MNALDLDSIKHDGEMFYATIDSGAASCVVPSGWFPEVPLRPTLKSESGASYKTADGSIVYDEGEKRIPVQAEDGSIRHLNCSSTAVHKILLAVSKLVEKGHEVKFSPNGHHIKHLATGKVLPVYENRGVYVIKLRARAGASRTGEDLGAMMGGPRLARP